MLYRENGQFKTSYRADQQIFPILQDRIAIGLLLVVAFVAVPLLADEYLLRAILIPFLILSLAALGPQHPGRLLRPDLARHRRLHGGRCLRRLQLHGPRSTACR